MSAVQPQEANRKRHYSGREPTVRPLRRNQADGAFPFFRTTLPAESSVGQSSN